MTKRHYGVINGTCGYLPDNHDDGFANRREAERYAVELARQFREDGYVVKGNAKYGYSFLPATAGTYTLSGYIEVVELDYPLDEAGSF